jgi:hypothetical protein
LKKVKLAVWPEGCAGFSAASKQVPHVQSPRMLLDMT